MVVPAIEEQLLHWVMLQSDFLHGFCCSRVVSKNYVSQNNYVSNCFSYRRPASLRSVLVKEALTQVLTCMHLLLQRQHFCFGSALT